VYVPTGFVDRAQLIDAVANAAKTLDSGEVRDVRFTIGEDANGEPSIFFGILLTTYASNSSRLADVTGRVSTTLFDRLQPYNRWGLQPYFNFTSDLAHSGIQGGCDVAFAEDLLNQALHLLNKEPNNPKQASLRRAGWVVPNVRNRPLPCERKRGHQVRSEARRRLSFGAVTAVSFERCHFQKSHGAECPRFLSIR